MKKIVAVGLVLAGLMGCGGGGGGGSTTPQPQPQPVTGKSTVLVYMVGSDLESKGNAASIDIQEMMQVGSNANLDVIIETGGANKTDWTTVRRTRVLNNDAQDLGDIGSLSMGDPNTLRDFITWGINTYPADKYHLILWNHGGGVDGFGWDEVHGNDNLTLAEIEQALSQAKTITGKKLEVLGFDACLMATVEVCSLSANYANYLVASEEVEPGHGWDYTPILTTLAANPTMAGNTLGTAIANSYKAQANAVADQYRAAGNAYNSEKTITLSVIDLARIGDVKTAWEALMAAANPTTNAEYLAFGKAASEAWRFGEGQRAGQGDKDMVDMNDLATRFASSHPTQAGAVTSAITQAVKYNVTGLEQTGAKGLSVRFAKSSAELTSYQSNTDLTSYTNALNSYIDYTNADVTAPAITNTSLDFGTGTISADIAGDDIANLFATVWYQNPADGTYVFLGMDSPDSMVGTTVSYAVPTEWVTLDGNYVAVFVIGENANRTQLDVPVLLNGVEVDILAWVDNTTGAFSIEGAWPGYDNGMAERQLLPIKDGDKIRPYFSTFNSTTGQWEYLLGDEFTVTGTPVLAISAMPKGNYMVAYYAEDLAGNVSFSDVVAGQYAILKTAFGARSPDLGQAKANALEIIREFRRTR